MIITYHNHQSFKISFGDTTLAFDPISKKSKLKSTSFGADIALVSTNHPDMNGVDVVTRSGKEPFAITGPGEYETKGVFVRGLATKTEYAKQKVNTLYDVLLEDMHVVFAGALATADLSADVLEALDAVDVLIVPLSGAGVLNAVDAHKLAVKLEAKIVIPMHYAPKDLKTFLKEAGDEKIKPIDKLTLKKKDLEGKTGEVVVLSGN